MPFAVNVVSDERYRVETDYQFFSVKCDIAFATPLKYCSCVSQEVIVIGSKNEHVVDVDLTYVVYEAV